MKKVVLTIAIVLGIGFGASAQSDGFFSERQSAYRIYDEEEEILPALPYSHNLLEHQPAKAVPVGSGLLLLTGMGLGYAALRKRD